MLLSQCVNKLFQSKFARSIENTKYFFSGRVTSLEYCVSCKVLPVYSLYSPK